MAVAEGARRRLVLNPTLQLVTTIEVSQRGRGRRRLEVTDARAVRFLLSTVARDGRRPRLDGGTRRHLLDAGVFVRPEQVPRDVHLDPRLDLDVAPGRPGASSLRLSPGCRLYRGPGLPPEIARRAAIHEPFLPDEAILWVRHPETRITLPYTLAPRLAGAVRDVLTGRRGPSRLPPRAAAVLHHVGALDDTGDAARRRAAWRSQVRAWRRELRTRRYAVLRGLFSLIFLAAVRTYYRRLESEGYLLAGAPRRRGSALLYDEPLMGFLGGQLASVVRHATGERAPSTFSFLRVYDPGAILESHRDAPFCRWNIDLVVGGEPAPDRRTAWPLWLDGRRGPRAVRLGLGDGVLYRGDRVRHWRGPQPAGRTTVLASLHYGRAARRDPT